ncbi:tetratricopeptide repeat-containing sensor histidine kinase [Mongoliitalea daihaiensis]|uniref:tetratricopeptide repeat-containing sensor histidine kinase n=1 Tax=Mongoliitalea daihaiensis TaxID=2782006 RepID=UPI001F17893A|nr:HAMP domain-containing sensor histidine kinase [Mongoliitalea daihaiensis]UJP64207.1 two-component sensor histidine kinase [Mongoliitalea daihaiensis]
MRFHWIFILLVYFISSFVTFTGTFNNAYGQENNVYGQEHSKAADSLYQQLNQTTDQKSRLEILSAFVREIHYSDSAQGYYLEAIELAKNLNNPTLLAQNLTRLGVYYRNNNLQDLAILNYEEALKVSQKANDLLQMGHALNSIGQIYYYQDLFEEALKYYEQSGEYFQQINDLDGTAYNLTGKSLVLGSLGRYLEALEAIDDAISIRSKRGNGRQLIVSRFNKAQLLLDMGDYQSARKDIIALYEYGKQNDLVRALQALEKLAEIELKTTNFSSVKRIVDEAIELNQEKPNRESIIAILITGIEVARIENNLERLSYLQNLLANEKELLNTQKTREYLAKLTIQRQKLEIDQLNRENELILKAEKFQNYIFILFLAISIILFIIVIIYKRYLNYHRELNQKLKIQKIKMEVQAEELFKTNRIKDKILSILAHDLRGPLHSLQGMLDLVNIKSLTQEEFQEYAPKISLDLGNNVLLLENLLLWSKNQLKGTKSEKSTFDIYQLIEKNFEIIRSSNNYKGQELINSIRPQTTLLADKNTIEIVLRNLLNNAIKFTKSEDQVSVNFRDFDGYYWICVEDQGIGMTDETKNKLFKNDFFTTLGTNQEGGTGLGLMISRELIERNKGKIWVESEEGKGSKFIFTIPKN